MKMRRLVSKVLLMGILVSCMSNVVGCSQQNLDKVADKIETDLIAYKDENIEKYDEDFVHGQVDDLSRTRKIIDINVEIEEEKEDYRVTITNTYDFPDRLDDEINIILVDKNIDLKNLDIRKTENRDVKFAGFIIYGDSLKCIEGFDGYTETNDTGDDTYDTITIMDESILRHFFYKNLGVIEDKDEIINSAEEIDNTEHDNNDILTEKSEFLGNMIKEVICENGKDNMYNSICVNIKDSETDSDKFDMIITLEFTDGTLEKFYGDINKSDVDLYSEDDFDNESQFEVFCNLYRTEKCDKDGNVESYVDSLEAEDEANMYITQNDIKHSFFKDYLGQDTVKSTIDLLR